MQASYQILVIDPITGLTTGIIDSQSIIDIQYSRILNGIGRLAVSVPANDKWNTLFNLDTLIEVWRTHPVTGVLTKEETYLTRIFTRNQAESTDTLTIGGLSLNHLLTRRVINPNDDPLVAGGYSTKAGTADKVIYDYVNEQMGPAASADRQMAHFTLVASLVSADGAGARLSYENLFDEISKLAVAGKTDFIIERVTDNNLAMYIGPYGTDKTKGTNWPLYPWVGLSPSRGNLPEASIVLDRSQEKNFIYCLGNGEGDRRDILEVPGQGMADSPWNRCEYSEDARNTERNDAIGLLTAATSSLFDNRVKRIFTYNSKADEPGNTYRKDWDVGDKITVLWDNIELDLRVTEVTLSFDQTQESISVVVEQQSGFTI